MQLFNQINARKLLGEVNPFSDFFNNGLFIGITLLTFAIQLFMVESGGKAIQTYPLDFSQNLFCLTIGSLELIWGLIVGKFPVKFFQCYRLDETPTD